MRYIPAGRHGMRRSEWKIYGLMMLTSTQSPSSLNSVIVVDQPSTMSYRSMSARCGLGEKTVEHGMKALKEGGFVERVPRGKGLVGYVLKLPRLEGDYVPVDEREALKCFAYGAPECGWDVVSMAACRREWDGRAPWVEMAKEVGVSAGKMEVALAWTLQQGMVEERGLWRDGARRVAIDVKTG